MREPTARVRGSPGKVQQFRHGIFAPRLTRDERVLSVLVRKSGAQNRVSLFRQLHDHPVKVVPLLYKRRKLLLDPEPNQVEALRDGVEVRGRVVAGLEIGVQPHIEVIEQPLQIRKLQGDLAQRLYVIIGSHISRNGSNYVFAVECPAMKRAFLLGVFCLWSISASAADKWTRVQSKNFTLVGNASENEIREVAEGLEVFGTAFSKFFEIKNRSSIPTTVVVFRSDQAFKPYKPQYNGKPGNVAGYFQKGQDTNYIALAADMETPRVIYHELVHRLLSDNYSSFPAWFQEGFAECFSSFEVIGKDKKVRLGRALGEHVELLNERQFMPLEQLFSVVHSSKEYNEAEKQGLFYAESWAFVHYMMFATPERRAQFMTFLNSVAQGGRPADVFKRVFNQELTAFQKTFEAYIQQRMAWNAFEMNTAGGLDRTKDMPARVLTEAEAEAYLGDLLLHTQRPADAETHLTKALKLDAKLGIAQASMGRLLMQTNKTAEAVPYFQRAIELDPDNYLTHYYYAALLNRGRGPASDIDATTMRAELKKAVQLAPHFAEATLMLANLNLARDIEIPETVEMLATALRTSPGNDYMASQLAFALSRTQQKETGRSLALNLLAKPSLDEVVKLNLQNLLAYLDRAAEVDRMNRQTAARNNAPPEIRPDVVRDPAPEFTKEERERLERALDNTPPGMARIRGTMTLLDCRNGGVTISLVTDGKTVKLHTNNPNDLKFTTYIAAVSKQIACGPMPNGGIPAVILYKPRAEADSIGEPMSVEFSAVGERPKNPELPTIPGTSLARGFMTKLECSGSATFEITIDGKTLKFFHADAKKVAFTNGPNSDGSVDCTAFPPPGLPVAVLYRAATTGDVAGEPVWVQFEK